MAMQVEPATLGVAEVVGDAASLEELRSCKIGGCCGKATPLLAHDAVLLRLRVLPEWTISGDRKAISRSFVAKNFKSAMQFLNDVGALAEEEGHHPDLHLTGWRNVRLELSTHAIGGLSLPDFVLAAKIDRIEVECSPKWLKEQREAAEQPPPPDGLVAERLAKAERYLAQGGARDYESLLGTLAPGCVLFGEPASSAGLARHFSSPPDVEFAVTAAPRLLCPNDPYTVRVDYTRSWRHPGDAGTQMSSEATEFLTFGPDGKVTHVGYIQAPPLFLQLLAAGAAGAAC